MLALPRPVAAREVSEALEDLLGSGQNPALSWSDFRDSKTVLQAIYLTTGFRPLWLDERGQPRAVAQALVAQISQVSDRALRPGDYDVDTLTSWLAQPPGDADQQALLEVALSTTATRLLRHVYFGRVNPARVGFGVDTGRKHLDLPAAVLWMARTGEVAGMLSRLDPPFPLYVRLLEVLGTYRDLAAAEPPIRIPANLPKLRPNMSDPAVAAIRARLQYLGDFNAPLPPPKREKVYDAELVEAVKRFQLRHGLADDAVIGRGTLEAMRIPLRERVVEIELAIERLRWLPRRTEERFIIVNIPEFRLSAFEEGHAGPVLTSNVVVGSVAEQTETPIISADMRFVVFRPYWNVPKSIAEKEILPKARNDPSYLARHQMEIVRGRIRQKPGLDNSLGLIKFLFPNRYHVYLHDTPSKNLFGRTRRDFSHGCIRVAKPVDLAEFVLRNENTWTRQDITHAMLEGPDNRHLELRHPIPVYLLYSTAIVDRAGEVRFLEDIYGHDVGLQKVLDKGPPYP